MELLTFPMFLAAMVVPHSTVLYWLTNGLFGMGLQAALGHPKVAAAVGLPMLAVHTRDARLAAGWCTRSLIASPGGKGKES